LGNETGETLYEYKITVALPDNLRLVYINDPFGRYKNAATAVYGNALNWEFESVPPGFGRNAAVMLIYESVDGKFPGKLNGRVSYKYPDIFDSSVAFESVAAVTDAPAPTKAGTVTDVPEETTSPVIIQSTEKVVVWRAVQTSSAPASVKPKITVQPLSVILIAAGFILWLRKRLKKLRRKALFKKILFMSKPF
jgi:hypothetical protein